MTTERELISHMVAVIADAHDECLDGMNTSARERLMDLIREGNAYLQQTAPAAPVAPAEYQPHDVPDGVWEALQRMIEDGATKGPASKEDALLVARYRARLVAAPVAPAETICPACGSDCNERDELTKAEREIERLRARILDLEADHEHGAGVIEQMLAERNAAPVAPALVPLTNERDRPDQGASYVPGYGFVSTTELRAIEAAHGIKP